MCPPTPAREVQLDATYRSPARHCAACDSRAVAPDRTGCRGRPVTALWSGRKALHELDHEERKRLVLRPAQAAGRDADPLPGDLAETGARARHVAFLEQLPGVA